MSGLRELKTQQAREWVLAHPDQSKAEQAKGAGVSGTLIGQVRAQLIVDGLLQPSRKQPPPVSKPTEVSPPVTKPPTMLDHEAMQALADMISLADSGDDDEVMRRLSKQCLLFAFDPKLHPDTRMSASQMWAKFRDQRKARDLGPGTPVDFETGVARLADLHRACGPTMVLAAVNVAFTVQEGVADASTSPTEQTPAAGGTAQATSPS